MRSRKSSYVCDMFVIYLRVHLTTRELPAERLFRRKARRRLRYVAPARCALPAGQPRGAPDHRGERSDPEERWDDHPSAYLSLPVWYPHLPVARPRSSPSTRRGLTPHMGYQAARA